MPELSTHPEAAAFHTIPRPTQELGRLALPAAVDAIATDTHELQRISEEQTRLAEAQAHRVEVMHTLLEQPDYDYAEQLGIMDMFHIDEKTGEDGLLHTLVGQSFVDEKGVRHVGGFHHEPSAERAFPEDIKLPSGEVVRHTRVDRTHLEGANQKKRAKYRDQPWEPYTAHVVVGGTHKTYVENNSEGTPQIVPAKNGMYPKEYDPMGVLQTIRIAYNGLNSENARPSKDVHGNDVLVNEGMAPLLDGVSGMKIRFILDAETGKIRTAIPVRTSMNIMGLTPEQLDDLLFS